MPFDDINYLSDLTEPEPMHLVESNIATLSIDEQENYLWRVELYLVSRFQPEFAEATTWKLYTAAKERAKVVKEHHSVLPNLSAFENELVGDLVRTCPWTPQKQHHHNSTYAPTPGIANKYQRELDEQ